MELVVLGPIHNLQMDESWPLGLQINCQKTKIQTTCANSEPTTVVSDNDVDIVGSPVQSTSSIEAEIRFHIGVARVYMNLLSKHITSITPVTKIHLC